MFVSKSNRLPKRKSEHGAEVIKFVNTLPVHLEKVKIRRTYLLIQTALSGNNTKFLMRNTEPRTVQKEVNKSI